MSKLSFEEAIKHFSDTYYDEDHDCEICREIVSILNDYDLNYPTKIWDYDD